ncbi:bifunctional hydroxymethylpyrimidine kinase/phosphomethylpyrimidine kinase, partial [Sphingomonas sp.]|uniref:bifunctional hydroxymethylpyrimidine kinase/phosphomethylpyrimidine kinase n=1 Tax=Sphingomonas sp. TaxID=28214 RepID=UPI00333E7003
GVQAVMPVPTEMVIAQIESCVSDIGVDAVKIGMLGSAATAHAVADWLEARLSTATFPGEGRGPVAPGEVTKRSDQLATGLPHGAGLRRGSEAGKVPIVFDPVMVATSGDVLADADTIAAFGRLMRIATVVTPNLPELAALLSPVRPEPVEGQDATSVAFAGGASTGSARAGEGTAHLAQALGTTVLVKGGHGDGDTLTDRLIGPDGEIAHWSSARIATTSTHGTGCTLASAIATFLAEGRSLQESVTRARQFVRLALHGAPGFGGGHGPMGHQSVRLDLGPGVRLNQVTVGCADYAASRDFYRMLGLKQIVDSPDHYARFEAPGGATLSIEHGAAATVFFECADLDAEVARLQAAGLVFDHLPVAQEWLWREARLTDPAGNTICLYQAGENRRYPPWRIPDA